MPGLKPNYLGAVFNPLREAVEEFNKAETWREKAPIIHRLIEASDNILEGFALDEFLWRGDLAGYEIYPGSDYTPPRKWLVLYHRCGWNVDIYPADGYIGNIEAKAIAHRREGCRRQ